MTNYPGDKADLNSALHFGDTPFDEEDYADTELVEAKVSKMPSCSFCGEEAKYDFRINTGQWAYGCEKDYQAKRMYTNLGTGKGQRLVQE